MILSLLKGIIDWLLQGGSGKESLQTPLPPASPAASDTDTVMGRLLRLAILQDPTQAKVRVVVIVSSVVGPDADLFGQVNVWGGSESTNFLYRTPPLLRKKE